MPTRAVQETMKKLLNKIRRKKTEEPSSRITAETIAEHRERVLAGGRRFKYPVQVARHRLVITAISIAVTAILLFIGLVVWQLYGAQASGTFFYRVTSVVPLPVASVDGQSVLYSDYLMKYRSSVHYLQDKEQVNLKSEEGQQQAIHVKSEAMQDAVADAYAQKLAKKNDITVTSDELQLFLKQQRLSSNGEISVATYNAVILDYYGWSPQEYEHATYNKLLRQKVSYAIDTKATETAEAAGVAVSGGQTDLQALAKTLNDQNSIVTYASSGLVPKNNEDGGLAIAAATLQVGGISSVIKPTNGDGYYILKLLEANDTQLNYEYVHIALTAFDVQLATLATDKKINYYITLPEDPTTTAKK